MSEKIVQLNEEVIKGQIKELVRGSVEETLNELLEKEAESLTQAARYERSETRQGYRSGHYDRNLTTTSGDVTLHLHPHLPQERLLRLHLQNHALLLEAVQNPSDLRVRSKALLIGTSLFKVSIVTGRKPTHPGLRPVLFAVYYGFTTIWQQNSFKC